MSSSLEPVNVTFHGRDIADVVKSKDFEVIRDHQQGTWTGSVAQVVEACLASARS
jgi:hypothetical protein